MAIPSLKGALLGAALVLAGIVLLAYGNFAARAASSFTYRTFQVLVGGSYVVPTSPTLSYATQLQAPILTAASSTTGGSLTPGPLKLQVVATTLTGTSTPSNEVATTSLSSARVYLSWPPVPGATGYAIYVGTSTPGSEQSYFEATSTSGAVNTNYTLTSTSSPTYNTLSAQGAGYYASMGSASTTFDTTGIIRSSTSATTTCNAATKGAIFYNPVSDLLWLCKAAGWAVVK